MQINKILKHAIVWKLANTMLVFLINLLLVRLLGAADSGVFFYEITVLSFWVQVISFSLESGITYFGSKDNRTLSALIFVILPLLFAQALAISALLKFFTFSTGNFFSIIFIVSNLAIIYFSAFFYAKKWFISLNIITCIINLFTILVLFYFWINHAGIGKEGNYIAGIYYYSLAVQALVLIGVVWFTTKKIKLTSNSLLLVTRDIFSYSILAFFSNIIFFLVTRIDYFFVKKYCTNLELGNYVQVSKFGQLLILIPTIIASIIFPFSSVNSNQMPVIKLQELCRTITFIFIPISLIVILTGSWVLPWIFGKQFNLMYASLLLYMPGFFALSIITVLAAYLAGKRLIKINLAASLIALVFVVFGDVLLIPMYSIYAAAAISSIAYISAAIYLLLIYKNRFQCNTVDFFYLKKSEIITMLNQLKNYTFFKH